MSELYTQELGIPVIDRTDALHIPTQLDGTLEPVVNLPNPDGARNQMYAFDEVSDRAPELAAVADVLKYAPNGKQDEAAIDAANEVIEQHPGILVAFGALKREVKKDSAAETAAARRTVRGATLLEFMRRNDGSVVTVVADTNGQERILPQNADMALYTPAVTDARGAAQRSLSGQPLSRAG